MHIVCALSLTQDRPLNGEALHSFTIDRSFTIIHSMMHPPIEIYCTIEIFRANNKCLFGRVLMLLINSSSDEFLERNSLFQSSYFNYFKRNNIVSNCEDVICDKHLNNL